MYKYYAFNLNILSELPFPELVEKTDFTTLIPDVKISIGEVSPQGLERAQLTRLFYQANENELWLHVPNVARFHICNGQQITIHPLPDSQIESIRLFLLGSCIGALLMQRNLFLLHANAIKVGQHCISFSGQSGAGKSTLCGAFYQRGYSVLADDVCAINDKGEVIPSFPQIKLWHDSAKHLKIETTSLRKIRPHLEKFALPLGKHFHENALPLKIIYLLNTHNQSDFCFETIHGMQKLNPLKNNSYRANYTQC